MDLPGHRRQDHRDHRLADAQQALPAPPVGLHPIQHLPQVQRLLGAARAAHHIVAARRPPLWVTEFSWDTNPPDPKAVPERLQARWVSEGLYRM